MGTDRGEERLEQFWRWVERTLAEKDLSYRQVERRAGVANATISKRARLRLEPTRTTYRVLSEVLGMSARDLMVKSGRIEEVSDLVSDSDFYKIMKALQYMTPKEVTNIARYIEFQFPEVHKALQSELPPDSAQLGDDNPQDTEAEA
jgi:transcriptional regulator with XRE-family HTH domain